MIEIIIILVFVVIIGFVIHDIWFDSESNKIEKLEEKSAYLKGYEAGFVAGRREGLFKQYTPNQIREAFGLEPVIGKEEKDVN